MNEHDLLLEQVATIQAWLDNQAEITVPQVLAVLRRLEAAIAEEKADSLFVQVAQLPSSTGGPRRHDHLRLV